MKNMNFGLESGQEIKLDGAIDKHLITEILGRIKMVDDYEGEQFGAVDSYEDSLRLARIYQDLSIEGRVKEETKEETSKDFSPYTFPEYWCTSGAMDQENGILLSTLELLVEYKPILGPKKVKVLSDEIGHRWLSSMRACSDQEDRHSYRLSTTMKQIVFVSLLACAEKFGDSQELEGFDLLEVEVVDGHTKLLNGIDIEQMKIIYSVNYSDKPELQEILVKGFLEKVQSNPGEFILVRFEGNIIGYYELEDLGKNKIHFGKFNVAPGLEGVGIGGLLLDKKLNIDAERNIISAESDLLSGASRNYLENGFVAYKATLLGEIVALSIARNDSFVGQFESKKLEADDVFNKDPQRDIVSKYGAESSSHEEFELSGKDIIVLKVPWWDDPYMFGNESKLTRKTEDLFGGKVNDRRYVITRIFRRKMNVDGEMAYDNYFVFESIKDEDLDSYLNKFETNRVAE